ncbi:MAG: hypothetical protein M3A44_00345 [Gammaproteobacteria bacterium]
MEKKKWDIRWEGRHWRGDECLERNERLPESFRVQIHDGQLGFGEQERLTVLAMLLENLGLDSAFRFLLDISFQDGEISREDFQLLNEFITNFSLRGDESPPSCLAAALVSMPDVGKDSDFDR